MSSNERPDSKQTFFKLGLGTGRDVEFLILDGNDFCKQRA